MPATLKIKTSNIMTNTTFTIILNIGGDKYVLLAQNPTITSNTMMTNAVIDMTFSFNF